jgi:predicted metalloprotease
MLMERRPPPPEASPPVNPQSSGQNPYAFLFEEQKKSKKFRVPSGGSRNQRIILVVGVVIIVMFLAFVVMTILGQAGQNNRQQLMSIAQQQAEVIRVADIGATKARDAQIRNLAKTTSQSLTSNQTALLAEYKKNGLKLGTKELAANKSATTDTLLNNADQSNNFDTIFMQELKKELSAYQSNVKTAYDSTQNTGTKAALSQAYTQAGILLDSK